MPVAQTTETATTQEMMPCVGCGELIPTSDPPSISHFGTCGGWACNQKCSDKADEDFYDRRQTAIGALFAEVTGLGLQ